MSIKCITRLRLLQLMAKFRTTLCLAGTKMQIPSEFSDVSDCMYIKTHCMSGSEFLTLSGLIGKPQEYSWERTVGGLARPL